MRSAPLLLLLIACGPGRLETVDPPDSAYAVTTENDLPLCNDASRGALFYVEELERFVVCRDNGWTPIDLRGPRGATGQPGNTGAAGATGAAAPGGTLVAASIYCSGLLAEIGLRASYDAVIFRSGDVFARGSISGSAFELSEAEFYSAKQNGAITGSVILVYDVEGTANGGWFQLSLDRATLITSVAYSDVDSPGGKRTWTKPASDCVANVY